MRILQMIALNISQTHQVAEISLINGAWTALTMRFAPRMVSVMIHGLIANSEVITDLFDTVATSQCAASERASRAKWEAVSDLMDGLRAKLGPQALSLGIPGEVPGGYLGGKIAFGRIPDEEDFSGPPVADADTHFVTV